MTTKKHNFGFHLFQRINYMTHFPNFKSNSNSLLKKYLTEDVFNTLINKKTKLGYSLPLAINSGLVNTDSSIGVYAGDKESYEVFKELFNPIIKEYHNFTESNEHQSNLNITDLKINNPDPKGKYILSTRIRVGRNLKDTPLGSLISDDQRNEVENLIKTALMKLSDNLSGNYYPLNNMSETKREEMINNHFLFKQGDRFLEEAGLNRNWPHGRGIFHNIKKDFLVWINEEDQMRIISMQKGGNIKEVFSRLLSALNQLEKHLSFSYSNHLGYISSCPTNLGTAMRASVHISLPQLNNNKNKLEEITKKHHLQIRGIHGEHSESENAIFDISNQRRLGITEIEAIYDLYNGVVHLINEEKQLEF
jgi:creatine kinase/arginine kinase